MMNKRRFPLTNKGDIVADDEIRTEQNTVARNMGDKLFLGAGAVAFLVVIVGSTIAYFSEHPERTPQVATTEQWQSEEVTCTWSAPEGMTWGGARITLSRENEATQSANSSMRTETRSITMTRRFARGKKVFVELIAHTEGLFDVGCSDRKLQGALVCTVGGAVVKTEYTTAAVPECTQQFVVP